MSNPNESQSAKVLEICTEIAAAQRVVDEKRKHLVEALREGFGCGPRMSREAQLRVLADLFFDLGEPRMTWK